jgi:hypothetical protein
VKPVTNTVNGGKVLSIVSIIFLHVLNMKFDGRIEKSTVIYWHAPFKILFLISSKVENSDKLRLDYLSWTYIAMFFHYCQSGSEKCSNEPEKIYQIRQDFLLEGVLLLSNIN